MSGRRQLPNDSTTLSQSQSDCGRPVGAKQPPAHLPLHHATTSPLSRCLTTPAIVHRCKMTL